MKTKGPARPARPDAMSEVIALEKEIKELLLITRETIGLKKGRRVDMTYIFEGEAILAGKPSMLPGSRLEKLRLIAAELKKLSNPE